MTEPKKNTAHKRSSKKRATPKKELPQKLPLSTVRRAVELAMARGYFLGVLDAGSVRLQLSGRHPNIVLASDEVINLFSEEQPLDPRDEVYLPIIREHVDVLLGFNGMDMIDEAIKDTHFPALNSPGRIPYSDVLLQPASKRSRKSRRRKKKE
ncbi:MAG TPA: hypothetical protein VF528_09825 [Pyrinomonadaceae bacterium]|jgi:hypothetical protein